MSDTVIRVENLSKLYQLGEISTGTLSRDLHRWWAGIRGKEDPYRKIGQANDRSVKGTSDFVWALKDINFEVKQGEILGIIGRNGAGKSTLLKILSRVTKPTTGRIRVKGRMASLLEVGTGFHPELTGRENIFLNGAILGMRKSEIQAKLDEIVDFAGVERYLDTPVKRYSSGMYVRLAFAVAAHLEPEILVIDEVLAVGDAEFQKKCLGKMKDVSEKDGRTVLFVSHNMDSMQVLCERGMVLEKGQVAFFDTIEDSINYYRGSQNKFGFNILKETDYIQLKITDIQPLSEAKHAESLIIPLCFEVLKPIDTGIFVDIGLIDKNEKLMLHCQMEIVRKEIQVQKGSILELTYQVKQPHLAPGDYTLEVYVFDRHRQVLLWVNNIPILHIDSTNLFGITATYGRLRSPIIPPFQVDAKIKSNILNQSTTLSDLND